MKMDQLKELLYESLETELGGVQVYETAIKCARNQNLKKEWQKYHDQTRDHVTIVRDLMKELDMDADAETPGRKIVRQVGKSLVGAMEMAIASGDPVAAQLVAAECVVSAETKDHQNWELIGFVAKNEKNEMGKTLKAAFDAVEDEEDEHLYHTAGWVRELWIQSLGLPAVLPPPEEVKKVETAIGAARAKQERSKML